MDGIYLKRFLLRAIWIGLLSTWMIACGSTPQSAEPSLLQPFPLAPEIEAYYREVGGEEMLGALISPRLEEGQYVYQYTVNALLYTTKRLDSSQEVQFVPIGLDLNLPQIQKSSKTLESKRLEFPIYQEFLPVYEKLGRSRAGGALTGLRYNPRQRRYEQFFEGVGMYRLESDPPGKVKLLAYGTWKCGAACLYPVPAQAEVIPPINIDPRAASLADQLGVDLTGFALSPAIRGIDNNEIVIFENVVIELSSVSNREATLLPLPQKLGILPEGMVANQENDRMVFLSLHGDKGHHIWRPFMSYIDAHGGLELIGLPISEPIEWNKGDIRQCFENLCLIEDHQIEGVYRIRPSPLGFEYASLYFSGQGAEGQTNLQPSAQPSAQESASVGSEATQEVTLEIIEVRPFVDQQTQQEIGVIVRIGERLAMNIHPTLYLSLANGEIHQFSMPPTDEQGKSFLAIPPIQAPNGTLIEYRICIITSGGMEVCASDDFLVWSP